MCYIKIDSKYYNCNKIMVYKYIIQSKLTCAIVEALALIPIRFPNDVLIKNINSAIHDI